jgi:hypothetical protein
MTELSDEQKMMRQHFSNDEIKTIIDTLDGLKMVMLKDNEEISQISTKSVISKDNKLIISGYFNSLMLPLSKLFSYIDSFIRMKHKIISRLICKEIIVGFHKFSSGSFGLRFLRNSIIHQSYSIGTKNFALRAAAFGENKKPMIQEYVVPMNKLTNFIFELINYINACTNSLNEVITFDEMRSVGPDVDDYDE